MIKKTTLSLLKVILFLGVFFFTVYQSNAQATISASKFDFVNICAGDLVNGTPFNEYYVTFTYSDFPADVTFDVEISNESGVFLTTPILATKLETTNISATQQKIKFAIPSDLIGSDVYSLRIRSNKSVNSQRINNYVNSNSFAVYYKNYVDSFSINNQASTATYCSGGSLTLSIDNATPSVKESSPVNYSNLKYIWYKDDVAISGQTGASLTVNTPGSYYAKIDYGKCSDNNFSSNRVTVSSSSGTGAAVSISSSLGNPFCANGSNTILTATSGNSYIWKKDGVVISGATSRTYATNQSGVYTVDVNFGGCSGTASINLMSNSFESSLNISDTNDINTDLMETLSVEVTTDAIEPTFKWYLNNNVISGETSSSYIVTKRGNYKVVITQASGCIIEQELAFAVTCSSCTAPVSEVIPNFITPNGDNQNDSWFLPVQYTDLDPESIKTDITIISSTGDIKTYSGNYSNNNPWPESDSKASEAMNFKNVNPVYYYVIKRGSEERKGSITVIK